MKKNLLNFQFKIAIKQHKLNLRNFQDDMAHHLNTVTKLLFKNVTIKHDEYFFYNNF